MKLEPKDITIAIVSYYRANRLRRCLETIDSHFKCVVFDNNTTGEDLEILKQIDEDFPNAQFIYNPENVGLPKAWNEGTIQSDTDWVLMTCDDMLFDDDWFEVLNNILSEKPQLEQIHLNGWNAVAFHKKTIVRMGWWDERYRYYPSMEDDDWYLRTVEALKYSPIAGYPDHMSYPEDYKERMREEYDSREDYFNRDDNFTYYCNSIHSTHKVIGFSTITGQSEDAGSRNTTNNNSDKRTGVQFHHEKWKQVDPRTLPSHLKLIDHGILFGKDGRCWSRVLPDLDFYPEIRKQYAKKYFNIEL